MLASLGCHVLKKKKRSHCCLVCWADCGSWESLTPRPSEGLLSKRCKVLWVSIYSETAPQISFEFLFHTEGPLIYLMLGLDVEELFAYFNVHFQWWNNWNKYSELMLNTQNVKRQSIHCSNAVLVSDLLLQVMFLIRFLQLHWCLSCILLLLVFTTALIWVDLQASYSISSRLFLFVLSIFQR